MGESQLDSADGAGPNDRLHLDDARPRLRLHHLFALTAVMSVMLAVSGPREVYNVKTPSALQTVFLILGIVHTILSSAAITIVAYGIAWRRRGYVFFNEPGHWLLVSIAVSQLIFVFPTIVIRVLRFGDPQAARAGSPFVGLIFLAVMLLFQAAMFVLNFYIGRKRCHENVWSRVFYGKAAAAVLPVIGDLLVLVFLERAVRADNPRQPRFKQSKDQRGFVPLVVEPIRPRRSRDAAHTCGVVIQFTISGLTFISFAGTLLMVYWTIFAR